MTLYWILNTIDCQWSFWRRGLMCSCLRALQIILAAECWTFWSLSRRCFGEPVRRELQQWSLDKTKAQRKVFVASIWDSDWCYYNSPNFYVVCRQIWRCWWHMLLHGQIVREYYAQIVFLQGRPNNSVCEWRLDEDLEERVCLRQ